MTHVCLALVQVLAFKKYLTAGYTETLKSHWNILFFRLSRLGV